LQNQHLVFVLPQLWNDPYELAQFEYFLKDSNEIKQDNGYFFAAMISAIIRKTYAQCWTSLSESDALWRVHDTKGTGVRIKIKTANIPLLDGVDVVKVKYITDFKLLEYQDFKGNNFTQLFGLKRKAFAHEKEIRLVSQYRFSNAEDAEKHIQAELLKHSEDFRKKYIEESTLLPDELMSNVKDLIAKTGIVDLSDTKTISFGHIPNFIESVMLSPFAPDWLESTLETFCKSHNTKFLGKSKLYTLNKE